MRYLDNKRTKWPVDPALYPLTGKTTGEVYMPRPAPASRPCGALCGILRAALIVLAGYLLVCWYYSDNVNLFAVIFGD